MGRIFEKRKDRMFARWSKTAKAFTKLGKELAIAVKLGGPEPANNPRLRMAIQTARTLNMPKERVEAAIKRASSKGEAELQELTYEGYGPHGVAILVLAATDNTTRTVANVRSAFSHRGGALGTTGSLAHLFDKRGVFSLAPIHGDMDELELALIDLGLEEIFETDDGVMLYTTFEGYGDVQRELETRKLELRSAGVQYFPRMQTTLDPAGVQAVELLVSELEEDDDVQHVYHTLDAGNG